MTLLSTASGNPIPALCILGRGRYGRSRGRNPSGVFTFSYLIDVEGDPIIEVHDNQLF